jgi:hypothetical protein
MNKSTPLVLTLLLLAQSLVFAFPQQETMPRLTNKQIVEMVRAGLSPEVIISKIKTSRCNFETDPSLLTEMKQKGVPNEVLRAMIDAPYGPPQQQKTRPTTNAEANAQNETPASLTNDSIVKLTKSGLNDELIVNMVNTQSGNYQLGADDVLQLKKEQVTDKVINAMLHKASGVASEPVLNSTLVGAGGRPSEIGVYLKRANEWSELQPEVVNWKTGGVLKNIASLGVVKGDINGHIDGEASRNRVTNPLDFLIVAPEGVAITEYQLLKLNQHSNNREFRTVTGGVFHVKGGATRDLVNFEWKKVAPRTFSVRLAGLTKGEYGFLPPGAITSSSSGAPLGKIYSFGVE